MNLQLTILFVLVTASIDYPSGTGITFKDASEQIAPLETLYFYSLPPGSPQPWGYWSTDDRPTGPQYFKDAKITSVSYVYYTFNRPLHVLMKYFILEHHRWSISYSCRRKIFKVIVTEVLIKWSSCRFKASYIRNMNCTGTCFRL